MTFGVVSEVGRGMGVLVLKEKGKFWRFFAPIGLNGIFLTEMYLTHV